MSTHEEIMTVFEAEINAKTCLVARTRGVKHFYPTNVPMHVFSAFEPVFSNGNVVRDWERKTADCPEEAE